MAFEMRKDVWFAQHKNSGRLSGDQNSSAVAWKLKK